MMKNGNLYKWMATLIALVFISAIGFSQTDKKVEKKEKTYQVKIKDDGKSTEVDTIIIVKSGVDVDIEAIMKEIEVEMDINQKQLKEIHVQLQAEMDEIHDVMKFELQEVSDEVEKALETLQKELEHLDIEAEVKAKIDAAMKTLEESNVKSETHIEKIIMSGHPVFVSEDGHMEVIVDGEGHTEAKVLWLEKDGDHGEQEVNVWIDEDGNVNKIGEHDVNVWVDDDEQKVIIKKYKTASDEDIALYGDVDKAHKMVMIKNVEGDMDRDMFMVHPASDKDFEKALAAGLPLAKDQRMKDIDLNINIDGDNDPVFSFKTKEKGKMKVTYYTADFIKGNTVKLKEENGLHQFPLNKEELKQENVHYMMIEQNGKADLMKLK